jgi:hypothetical protein
LFRGTPLDGRAWPTAGFDGGHALWLAVFSTETAWNLDYAHDQPHERWSRLAVLFGLSKSA